jgi:hypothetical protein
MTFNLTFDDNAPIDANQLRGLVSYLNEVNTKALQIPDTQGLINSTLTAKMTAGTQKCGVGNLGLNAKQKQFDIVFKPSLSSDPSTVQITVESAGKDGDFTYYIQSPTKSGCKIFFNAVQGQSNTAAAVIGDVIVHYFAMAG